MNNHIATALKTWYPKDHPLHFDLEPSLMGLAGECGELIDLYKKAKFKPGFELTKEMELDELGDIWYYLRIVAYQINYEFPEFSYQGTLSLLDTIISMYHSCGSMMGELLFREKEKSYRTLGVGTRNIYEELNIILSNKFNCTLDELTKLNWQKLSKREDEKIGYGFKHA